MSRLYNKSYQSIFQADLTADLVNPISKTADELAKETGTHPRSLYRLLRARASVGIFSEDTDQIWNSVKQLVILYFAAKPS